MNMKKNNKKGFTLVELVIVVAVMAILVAVAIPTVRSITSSATNSVNESNANTIESMIKLYMADNEATVGEDTIDAAVTEANLGIDKGKFVYDDTTGSVKVADSTSKTGEYLIVIDEDATDPDDYVTVTGYTAGP